MSVGRRGPGYRVGTPDHVELAYSKADERADFRHAIISYSGASDPWHCYR